MTSKFVLKRLYSLTTAPQITMQITSEQLRQISIFRELNPEQLLQLHPHAMVQYYSQGEIILHEGDSRSGRLRQRLPAKLFAVFRGVTQIKKTASTGKETILRTLPAGEIFAAPAIAVMAVQA
jgi:CRP/FNR family transcriptional regulator, cyclic AMP receptor protein